MKLEFIFFQKKDIDFTKIMKPLEKKIQKYRFVINSVEVENLLKKNKINYTRLEHVSNYGSVGKEVYQNAKHIHQQYEKNLQELIYHGLNIFEGIDYSLIRQFYYLAKIKKILIKKSNTIFLFEGFSPIYFGIMGVGKELGYEVKEMGELKKQEIIYFKYNEIGDDNLVKNYSLRRARNFINAKYGTEHSINNLKMIFEFLFRLIKFGIKKEFSKHYVSNDDFINYIQKRIYKKIWNTKNQNKSKCLLFITGSRLDLYLRPWLPVLEKFDDLNIPYNIFTSDIITSTVLSEKKIPYVSLFEEVNMLSNKIKINNLENIRDKVDSILEKNKSLPYFEQLKDDLKNKIFRAYAVAIICDYIISKMPNLNSILGAVDGEMLESLAIESARKSEIESFSMVHGITNPQPLFADWLHSDKTFVSGLHGFESLEGLGYSKNQIIISGNPKYDYFNKINVEMAKKFLKEKYSIADNKKLIVVGLSFWRNNDEMWMTDLIKLCNQNGFEIVIKIHPKYQFLLRSLSESKINNIKKECKNLKFLISYNIDLAKLLSASDLMITDFSSIGLEAIILGKPLITVNFEKENLDNKPRYHEYGASIYVENPLELKNLILEILEKNLHLDELKEGRKKAVERYNFKNDGKSADRIIKKLIKN